jgi:hypothetical protein
MGKIKVIRKLKQENEEIRQLSQNSHIPEMK